MYRTFNMGIGMVLVIEDKELEFVSNTLQNISPIFEIGEIVNGNKEVIIE